MADEKPNGPTEDDLRKMSPEERVKALKALEERRRKELEEAKKKAEAEIAQAEELLEEIEEEEVEGESKTAKKEETRTPRRGEGDDLEERVGREKAAKDASAQEAAGRQYDTGGSYERRTPGAPGSELYNTLERAADNLERLYANTDWGARETEMYRESKETLERARGYNLTSEKLREEFGTAESVLKRLQYRH